MSVTSTAAPAKSPVEQPRRVAGGLLDPKQLWKSLPDALRKLNPATLWRNPVMFIVEVGAAFTTVLAIADPSVFAWMITVWLWLTVVFANLAEAVAEGRGKAQADALRKAKQETVARRLIGWVEGAAPGSYREESIDAVALQQGDIVVVEAGQIIPGDGDVVEGIASVDESAITGESAPVIRESGGDRSAVTGGTRVLSDRIVVQITQKPGESFIDRMIALVEGANRQKTPNEIALNILLAALTIIFLLAVATLQPMAIFAKQWQAAAPDSLTLTGDGVTGVVLVALLVALIPTTIGALLSAIGIAGMDRLIQRNVLAVSGRAVEAAGDVNTSAARQDRHDHAGQPAGDRVHPGRRSQRAGPGRRRAARQPRRRDAGGPLDRRAGQERARAAGPRRGFHAARLLRSRSARRHGCPVWTFRATARRAGSARALRPR